MESSSSRLGTNVLTTVISIGSSICPTVEEVSRSFLIWRMLEEEEYDTGVVMDIQDSERAGLARGIAVPVIVSKLDFDREEASALCSARDRTAVPSESTSTLDLHSLRTSISATLLNMPPRRFAAE